MEILIRVSVGEIRFKGVWEAFCKLRDIDVQCFEEGSIEYDDKYTLTEEEAGDLGLLPVSIKQLRELDQLVKELQVPGPKKHAREVQNEV